MTADAQHIDRRAGAIRSGSAAFDLGVPRLSCPYPPPLDRYWAIGWNIRRRAVARWDRQADEVDATLTKAAPFLDRSWNAKDGSARPSQLIGLHFYAQGSREPDAAYAWFRSTIHMAREQYRQEGTPS
jgi:hypothetical protein